MSGITICLAEAARAVTSRRESADDYPNIVARLNNDWRVIVCRDGIQWILQRRNSAKTIAKPDWRGVSYCRARDALIRCVAEKISEQITFEGKEALFDLPARIGGAA